jgi:hypothetical protein
VCSVNFGWCLCFILFLNFLQSVLIVQIMAVAYLKVVYSYLCLGSCWERFKYFCSFIQEFVDITSG